ncbi:hypothetical protein H0H87_007198 [Tephrocybe sp. NHM501043]|nr:hypothetical protein H0H87_007198 [Tephrocybe sp. NHM501043]
MSDRLQPPPPGTNYLSEIEPSVIFSLLGAFFSGLLVPPCIFLILFTKPVARRHPVFILNLAIVILGLALAGINVGQEWSTLVDPTRPIPQSLTVANITLNTLPPIIIDSVLIFRLLAFYPSMITPLKARVMVLIFPVLVKSARLVSIILFLHKLAGENGEGSVTVLSQKTWFRNPYLASEWSLQIADNLYSTSFFFWKLRQFSRGGKTGFIVRNKSLMAKIRGIFAFALANFVFPLFMNITQLVLLIRDPNYARGAQTSMVNMYVSIFGILFATVWASGNAWGRDRDTSDQSAFETTIGDYPGYIKFRSETGPETDGRGSPASPKPYNLSFPEDQIENTLLSVRDGVHIEQMVVIKHDDILPPIVEGPAWH